MTRLLPLSTPRKPLLEVNGLVCRFERRTGRLFGARRGIGAVDNVSFSIGQGEAFGLVGESGSGKSTTAKAILGVCAPAFGTIRFAGRDLSNLSGPERKSLRREVQYVFQDPLGALDPRRSVLYQVVEPLTIHGLGTRDARLKQARDLLRFLSLNDDVDEKLPHELSGGQRQRVVLARALVLEPRLLICDEPVSALDVSIQAQVIRLLKDLRVRLGMALLFISHDLALVRYLCDRMAVMYSGRICEIGRTEAIFKRPRHPYTQALLSSIPCPDPRDRGAAVELPGEPPSPVTPPSGCRFHPRCAMALPRCSTEAPAFRVIEGDRSVCCHAVIGAA